MNLKIQMRKDELFHQYMIYRIILQGINSFVWIFYPILIYQATGSIGSALLDIVFTNFGLVLGYILAGYLMSKLGYLKLYQTQNILWILLFLVLLLILPEIASFFLFISIFKGVILGIFWSVNNVIQLKELEGRRRSSAFSVIESLKMLMSIAFPVAAGFLLVNFGGYQAIFVICILVYTGAMLLPFRYNKIIRSELSFKELKLVWNIRNLRNHIFYMSFKKGMMQYAVVLSILIPFLIFQNELSVGLFLGIASFIGAIIAYFERYLPRKKKFRQAEISRFFLFVFTLLLGIFWNGIWLFLREISSKLMVSFSYPIEADLEEHTNEKILGKYRSSSAVEFYVLQEICMMIGRNIILFIAFLILSFSETGQEAVIRVTYPIAIFLLFGSLYWLKRNHDMVKQDEY